MFRWQFDETLPHLRGTDARKVFHFLRCPVMSLNCCLFFFQRAQQIVGGCAGINRRRAANRRQDVRIAPGGFGKLQDARVQRARLLRDDASGERGIQ